MKQLSDGSDRELGSGTPRASQRESASSATSLDEQSSHSDALDGPTEESRPVMTIYYFCVEDAIEAIEAAAILGLGVALRNQTIPEEDDISSEQWVVELFSAAPEVAA
jgi:hypothetical protein